MDKPTLEQKQIFQFFKIGKGHGMIDAVAGSGKTSTIVEGIKHIDSNKKILFCAFNKKIQQEINEDTKNYKNVIVKTTYALGLSILKYHFDRNKKNHEIDESKYYCILNENLAKNKEGDYLVKSKFTKCFESIKSDYYRNLKKGEFDVFYKKFNSNYFKLVNLLRYTLCYGKGEEDFKKLVEKYAVDIDCQDTHILGLYKNLVDMAIVEGNDRAQLLGVFDYADMIFLPCELRLSPPVKYDIVLVDECQDLSNAQLKIISKFLKKDGRFFAVGDPYQSIYGFTGASPESFNNIKNIFKPEIFKLTNCFRCSHEIVELAKLIRSDISTKNSYKSKIENIKFYDLIKHIQAGDFIISRHNKDIFEAVFILLKNNIKFQIIGKNEILKSLKDIIPNNKIKCHNYYEELPVNLGKIIDNAENKLGKNPANYQKIENLEDSISILNTCFYNIESAKTLNDLFLYIENLMDSTDKDAVLLSSIHRAKGLQKKNVFIIGYENLPFKKEGMLEWQLYQENCIKYVAITRAIENLYLTESPKKIDNSLKNELSEGENLDLEDQIDNLPI